MKWIFLLLIFAFTVSFAEETPESIRKQIRAVEEETKREKALHEAEKKRHAEFIEAGRKKVQALNAQSKAVRAEIDSMRAEISRLADARNKALATSRRYESKKAKYRENLAQEILSLLPLIQADFPYRTTEAEESIQEIAEQLKKGTVSPDDALSRTLELLLERIRLGYTTEVWKGTLALGNREIPGTYLRYGAILSIFVSNDGNEVLWLSKEDQYRWHDESANMEMRTLLKEALKVAEGKAAPKLVLLPLIVVKENAQ